MSKKPSILWIVFTFDELNWEKKMCSSYLAPRIIEQYVKCIPGTGLFHDENLSVHTSMLGYNELTTRARLAIKFFFKKYRNAALSPYLRLLCCLQTRCRHLSSTVYTIT